MTEPIIEQLRQALHNLVWEVRHRQRPSKSFAFHKAEELLGVQGECDWPHGSVLLHHWGESRA